MFGIENYMGFIIAAIILTLTPGADTMYILTRSASQGKDAGLVSVAGVISGCVVHVLCAAFGLSMILSTSTVIFSMIKWAGALYLIYLGIKMFMEKNQVLKTLPNAHEPKRLIKIYKQGVFTNILNPKVGLFFISFLPQFINQNHASGPIPFLVLGATFLVIGTTYSIFIAFAASYMTNTLRNNKTAESILYKLSGIIFIGFGLKIAFNHD